MASSPTISSIALGVLAFGFLLCSVNSVYSPSEPTERIAPSTLFDEGSPNLNFIKYSVGAVMIKITTPDNVFQYIVLCTATLISAELMLSNANCLRNALKVADCDPTNENRQLLVAIGMDSTSVADMSKSAVVINTITTANLNFHPKSAAGSNNYDLVLITLVKKANTPMFNPVFVARYLNTTINSELGYYMVSWGQQACTGIVTAVRNVVTARSDPDTTSLVPNKGTDQIVHQLTNIRPQEDSYAAFGDMGSSIILPQNEGGSKIYFVIRSVLGVNDKQLLGDGRTPNAFGTSCSKASKVAATDLLNKDNYNFLYGVLVNITGDQMRYIFTEPI